jgi:hypothetical protein
VSAKIVELSGVASSCSIATKRRSEIESVNHRTMSGSDGRPICSAPIVYALDSTTIDLCLS